MANPIILIVDDTPSVRSLVGRLVVKLGFSIAEAGDGNEGLKKLAELKKAGTPPKLILSDLNMPNMDGISFITEVRKIDKATPILMLSTVDKPEEMARGKQAGANGWMVKPLSPVNFLDTIKKMTGV